MLKKHLKFKLKLFLSFSRTEKKFQTWSRHWSCLLRHPAKQKQAYRREKETFQPPPPPSAALVNETAFSPRKTLQRPLLPYRKKTMINLRSHKDLCSGPGKAKVLPTRNVSLTDTNRKYCLIKGPHGQGQCLLCLPDPRLLWPQDLPVIGWARNWSAGILMRKVTGSETALSRETARGSGGAPSARRKALHT